MSILLWLIIACPHIYNTYRTKNGKSVILVDAVSSQKALTVTKELVSDVQESLKKMLSNGLWSHAYKVHPAAVPALSAQAAHHNGQAWIENGHDYDHDNDQYNTNDIDMSSDHSEPEDVPRHAMDDIHTEFHQHARIQTCCEEVIGTRWTAIEALPSIMCEGSHMYTSEFLYQRINHAGAADVTHTKSTALYGAASCKGYSSFKGKILVVWNFRVVKLCRIVKKEQNRWIVQGLQK
ncbi:uncharacterized protein BJ212DRAFT_1302843 [Suillus subaureus]|uniref:Uncharacterized protein n=1 Tax=Suillus subaureus TaxID=48587 RepID=A0A9P7E231_9AGAM|nr:uncharacterized protein BJ212DRAFT_1302843 [Suillus subaureus]KAG1808953.1 hypothetical protein BJ212DRAFT_1302843 [Suillus subaureus]